MIFFHFSRSLNKQRETCSARETSSEKYLIHARITSQKKKMKKEKNDSENFEFIPEDTAVVTVRDGRI